MTLERFIVFILALTVGLVEVKAFFKTYFSEADALRDRVVQLDKRFRQENLRRELAAHQLAEFRQEVGRLLPGVIDSKSQNNNSYNLRNLASIVLSPTRNLRSEMAIERSEILFERAKKDFKNNQFGDATKIFIRIVEQFPDSVNAVEAYFLLAESQFRSDDLDGCVRTLNSMITLFPESQLTGYGLLRLGKIYEGQDRFEDAALIYRTIGHSFKEDQKLVDLARVSLKAVEL